MQSISPVFSDDEVHAEHVIALDQPEYQPIIALAIEYENGVRASAVRFELSDEERALIAAGADIVYIQLGSGFHPIVIEVCEKGKFPGIKV